MKTDLKYFTDFAQEKGGKCVSTYYTNCKTKLLFECVNGHQFETQPRKIREGIWCKECSRNRNRKYNIDEDFFKKDTPESFYIAGFVAADGWVRSNNNGNTLGIELSIKDKAHLEKINDTMSSNYKIKTFIKNNASLKAFSPNVKEFSEMCSLNIYNREIVKGLERFGIAPAKTYNLTIPEWLEHHPLVHHFMRGYIDGDGSFFIKDKSSIGFSMRGTVELLNSFHNILLKKNVVKQMSTRKKLTKKDGFKRAAFDILRYGGNGTISNMYDFLYKDSTICLERKRVMAASSKDLAIYGTDKKKKPKSTNLFDKERLLEVAAELKDRKKVCEYFGCTNANISWWLKKLDMREEFNAAIKTPMLL